MSKKFKGELEINEEKGVVYFHLTNPDQIKKLELMTMLRICQLEIPKDVKHIDITHMYGASYY